MTAIAERPDLVGTPSVVHKLVHFLETREVPEGLFTDDVFTDFTPPQWRLQALGLADSVGIRMAGHPSPGRVTRLRYDPTPGGFVLEFEEEWDDTAGHWYCREMLRADLCGDAICALSVYCTGDWDAALVARHRAEVRLIRP